MTELLDKIKSRGYWQVIIRPSTFVEDKISNFSSLLPLIQSKAVKIRGWDFPYISNRDDKKLAVNFVEQALDWEHHKEIWRFYQSGQFIHVKAMTLDWRDESTWWPADEHWAPKTQLGVADTTLTLYEIFELASRLAFSDAGDSSMEIDILISGLGGRTLYIDAPNKNSFLRPKVGHLEDFPIRVTVPKVDLSTSVKDLAVRYAKELFARFNWETTDEIVAKLLNV
ncbi:MAG: hypothetical protein KF701_05175 [Anaerolineales bacterium]|nr:MAG: hypothetical protein KF701_05175 [Anaerolineales bacterium]